MTNCELTINEKGFLCECFEDGLSEPVFSAPDLIKKREMGRRYFGGNASNNYENNHHVDRTMYLVKCQKYYLIEEKIYDNGITSEDILYSSPGLSDLMDIIQTPTIP
jgi:hypothetical protein